MRRANFSSGVGVLKKKPGHIKNLPEDILLDILSRLPVESVSECKLVCKMWLKLLHGTRSFFTKMHVSRQFKQLYGSAAGGDKLDMGFLFCCTRGDNDNPDDVLLFYGGSYNDKINTDGVYEFKKTLKKVRHPPMRYKLPRYYLVNSCNGLVCLGRHHHQCVDSTYIYNPATGEYVNLPKFIIPKGSYYPRIARGFGYVPSTNEYKVVRIFYPDLKTTGQIQVYTLGSGCGWRSKCEPFPWVNFIPPATFADGSLYWFNDIQIYSFDLAKEEVRVVPSPPCHSLSLGSHVHDKFGLVVLRGNLCFFHQTPSAPHMEIWSMKKTADMKESWRKDFSIVYEKKEKFQEFYWPIMVTKNNKIIFMKDNETIECYDPETTTWNEIVAYDPQFFIESISVNFPCEYFSFVKITGRKVEEEKLQK
ncbi:hypothetical protein MKX03_016007 [Papaver bracteatum]|nr:hypothetical protein MKX03_016007 [Papaver bracteatum]